MSKIHDIRLENVYKLDAYVVVEQLKKKLKCADANIKPVSCLIVVCKTSVSEVWSV